MPPVWLCCAALAAVPGTWADEAPRGGAQTGAAEAGSDIREARRALERGRDQLRAGAFEAARESFRLAVETAPASSALKDEALEHYEFHLPIARAQRSVLMGHPARAEKLLREALAANRAHPERVRQLHQILAHLASMPAAEAEPLGLDNRVVVGAVRGALEDFRRRVGRYPLSADELRHLAVDPATPLDEFDVVRFRGDGRGYLLVLRHRRDAAHVITLEKTGLLR